MSKEKIYIMTNTALKELRNGKIQKINGKKKAEIYNKLDIGEFVWIERNIGERTFIVAVDKNQINNNYSFRRVKKGNRYLMIGIKL